MGKIYWQPPGGRPLEKSVTDHIPVYQEDKVEFAKERAGNAATSSPRSERSAQR